MFLELSQMCRLILLLLALPVILGHNHLVPSQHQLQSPPQGGTISEVQDWGQKIEVFQLSDQNTDPVDPSIVLHRFPDANSYTLIRTTSVGMGLLIFCFMVMLCCPHLRYGCCGGSRVK